MFLLLMLARVTLPKPGTHSPALPRTLCRPHCPVWPCRPDSDVWTFSCLVMLNHKKVHEASNFSYHLLDSWRGRNKLFQGEAFLSVHCPPSPCSQSFQHPPKHCIHPSPHWFLRGLAVTREEIVRFSVWNYISRPAKQCQQRRESFDYAKWMDTSRLLLQ